MQFTRNDIEKIADLAHLDITDDTAETMASQLTNILHLVAAIDAHDLDTVSPLAHPLEVTQPQREDQVTEHNERAAFQAIAPNTHAGLYIVPQVIESE